jgi:hypothetical protein
MKTSLGTWITIIAAVLLSAFVSGCGTSSPSSGTSATLVSLSVTPPNSSIAPGTTAQLTATGMFSNGSTRNITSSTTWSSSDNNVAIFNNTDPRGLVTAQTTTLGTTIITAVSSGITGTTSLNTRDVASIVVTPSPVSIAPGTTQQFTAMGTLTDNTSQNLTSFATCTWTSSDPAITVSNAAGSKGLAGALSAPASATIQAAFDTVVGPTPITGIATLNSSHVVSILVSSPTLTLPKGLTQQFTAIGTLVLGAATQNLTTSALWTSSSPTVATISNTGLATALALGATNISASFDSITSSPTVTLTVTQPVLISIAITPTSKSIALGLTQQYKAIGTYSDGSTPDITSIVTWKSSQLGVATMSTSTKGLATSVAQGTTTITASLSNITSNSATLTVTPAALLSITISPASAVVFIPSSNTQQYTAQGTFTDGSRPIAATSLNWVSTNPDITIDNTGLATDTILTPRTTNITANSSLIFSNTATLTFTF